MREDLLSRRSLLLGGAAATGLASVSGLAKGKRKNLRGGEILPDPDFSLLRDKDPFLIGIRPYRTEGVRLELVDKPLAGGKRLIHNYGHGGAGVTLSWGCASVVKDHVQAVLDARKADGAKLAPSVAVIGTGVIGLTTATELRRAWPELPITLYAKSLDLSTTVSWVAGGQFEPSGMHRLYKTPAQREILHDYVRRARDRVVEIQNGGRRHDYGVAVRKNYTLDRPIKAFEEGCPRDVIAKPRRGRLPFAKLNGKGREYLTWLMTPQILMPQLVKDLKADGVRFTERAFKSEADVAALDENIIVNCTGLGARELFNDPHFIPQRGHNVLLKRTEKRQFYFMSGGCQNWVIAYFFCRQNDIVVGGTVQKGDDSLARTDDDEQIFQRLLANGRKMFGGQPKGCVRG